MAEKFFHEALAMWLIGRSSKDSLVPFGGKSALVLQKYKVTDLVEIEDDIVDVVSGQRARLHDARGFTDRGPVAKVLVQKKIRRKVACELEGVAVVGAVAVGDVADMRKPREFSYSRQLVVVIDAVKNLFFVGSCIQSCKQLGLVSSKPKGGDEMP